MFLATMPGQPALHPDIRHLLSAIQTREEALRFWRTHRDALAGYTFVLAEAEGPGALHFPARIDFPDGGHLRSVFALDNLFLINNDMLSQEAACGHFRIRASYTVAFDANVASYLRAWHQGRSAPVVEMLQSVFRKLNAGQFNWDLLPFLMERSEDMLAGRDLNQIYETQLAANWFAACDRAHFAATGEVRLTVPENQIVLRTQTALANWHRKLNEGMNDFIQQRFHLFHACLLKIVLLQLENPSPDATHTKMTAWLEFMHEKLHVLMILPTRAALEFFRRGGAFKPMAKVSTGSRSLRQKVRNVTWDFVQLIWRHTLTGFNDRVDGFFIPYFLTFDRGLADLYDLYPQGSCVFGNEFQPPQFFATMDLPALILESCPQLKPVASRIFNLAANTEREHHRRSQPAQDREIAAELEHRLAVYEN